VYNQVIVFQPNNEYEQLLLGVFPLPLKHSYLYGGLQINSLRKWFNNENPRVSYDLKTIIGNKPGIFMVYTCRGIDGFSYEGNRIKTFNQYGQLIDIKQPRQKSNTQSYMTRDLVAEARAAGVPKKDLGQLRIGLKQSHEKLRKLKKNIKNKRGTPNVESNEENTASSRRS